MINTFKKCYNANCLNILEKFYFGDYMTFVESVKYYLSTGYLKVDGRASRSEFWWFQLFYLFVCLLLGILAGILKSEIFYFIALAFVIPSLAVFIRRLHDINKSGWLLLLCLMPYIGFFVILIFLIFCLQKGTEEENRFGANPLNP